LALFLQLFCGARATERVYGTNCKTIRYLYSHSVYTPHYTIVHNWALFHKKMPLFCKIIASRFFYVRYFSYISTVIKNQRYMRKNKYPNGYIPKIQYWSGKLNQALAFGTSDEVEYATRKMNYFINRQLALQGETIA